MSRCFDKDGHRITINDWARLKGDESYSRIAETMVGGCRVSTVWLGLDHRHGGGGAPIIFETLVFRTGDPGLEDGERYSTEAEAIAGHARWVAQMQGGAS